MRACLLPPLVFLCSDLLLRSPALIPALSSPSDPALLRPAQVSVSRRPSDVIYHPSTGSCVVRKLLSDPLKLGPCNQSDSWSYTPQKFLVVKGTYLCLQAVESGKPAKLGIVCSESDSSWGITSNTEKRISTELPDGTTLCLDVDPSNTLITNPCLRFCSGDCSQGFELAKQNELVQVAGVSPLTAEEKPSSP